MYDNEKLKKAIDLAKEKKEETELLSEAEKLGIDVKKFLKKPISPDTGDETEKKDAENSEKNTAIDIAKIIADGNKKLIDEISKANKDNEKEDEKELPIVHG